MKTIKPILSALYFSPGVAFAQRRYEGLEPLRSGTMGTIITNIIEWILILAGALVVIYLIYGGIIYITAAGNEDKVKVGKSILYHAIVGVIIISVSFLLVRWIRSALEAGTF